MQARNSANAQQYADKRRMALERANKLREQRRLDEQRSDRGTSPISRGRESTSVASSGALVRGRDSSSSQSIIQARDTLALQSSNPDGYLQSFDRMTVRSFGDHTEHITLSRSAASKAQTLDYYGRNDISSGEDEGFSSSLLDALESNAMNPLLMPPSHSEGREVDLSCRPLICTSMDEDELVVGCADHALYSIDVQNPRARVQKMYSKQHGHTDWVTSVAHLSDGSVLSTAMDGNLCLWRNRRTCSYLPHHTKSISKVVSDGNLVATASYDCTVALWDFHSLEPEQDRSSKIKAVSTLRRNSSMSMPSITPIAVLEGHRSPVLETTLNQSVVASGGKDGGLLIHDTTTQQQLARVRGHASTITAMAFAACDNPTSASEKATEKASLGLPLFASPTLLYTSGTDGVLKLWDARMKKLLATSSSATSTTTDSPITCFQCLDENIVVSGNASGTVDVRDRRRDLLSVTQFNHARNGVYCMKASPFGFDSDDNRCLFVGDGTGMLFCYNIKTSTSREIRGRTALKYGLGASSSGAVRSIEIYQRRGKVVTAAEDGNVLIYSFP